MVIMHFITIFVSAADTRIMIYIYIFYFNIPWIKW